MLFEAVYKFAMEFVDAVVPASEESLFKSPSLPKEDMSLALSEERMFAAVVAVVAALDFFSAVVFTVLEEFVFVVLEVPVLEAVESVLEVSVDPV